MQQNILTVVILYNECINNIRSQIKKFQERIQSTWKISLNKVIDS